MAGSRAAPLAFHDRPSAPSLLGNFLWTSSFLFFSRAFTLGASISAKTKMKILAAAEKLDYQPNIIARSLSKSQSGLVGILFANWDHPKAAEILKGLCEAITEKRDHLALYDGDQRGA